MTFRKYRKLFLIFLIFQIISVASMESQIKEAASLRLGQGKGTAAIGIVSDEKTEIFFHGRADANTIFELCSVTKVFTALLLADMSVKQELSLDDPVNKYLESGSILPEELSLLHLATHTSGLPRSPSDFSMDYSQEQLYKFLSNFSFQRKAGEKFEYSNLGFGLMGHIMAAHIKTSFEWLLIDRICAPLLMNDTGITMTSEQQVRQAGGYTSDGRPVPTRELPVVYQSAGALRSTLNDMLKFLRANMDPESTQLTDALRLTHKSYFPSAIPETRTGLAWNVTDTGVSTIIWQEGQISSHYAFIGFDQKMGLGTVILSSSGIPLTDLGIHVLDARYPVRNVSPQTSVDFQPDEVYLDDFVGQYEVRPDFLITILKENGHLYSQTPGMPKLAMTPVSETEFSIKGLDIRILFFRGQDGRVTLLIVNQAGTEIKAHKKYLP